MELNSLTSKIIGCAIVVHKELGPGLYENTYERCLVYELNQAGLKVKTQVKIPLTYKDLTIDGAYKLDLLVEDLIIVELKAVDQLEDIHSAQLLTYLKLKKLNVGLLMNFNHKRLIYGIKRLENHIF